MTKKIRLAELVEALPLLRSLDEKVHPFDKLREAVFVSGRKVETDD